MPDRDFERIDQRAAATGKARGLVGRILLASAALMIGLAVVTWLGMLPIDTPVRTYVALTFVGAGVLDGYLALRFLGERTL
jgi:hypothetical protein